MAIRPSEEYPGQIAADGAYPYGKAQNVTGPGTGDGTPLEQKWVNDLWGFFQALLVEASITPSDAPDEVGASDYLNAVRFMALGAAISPAAIASNQSNYSPTDWSQCGVARLTSDANRTVLGLSASVTVARKLLVNANSTAARSITLKHDDGTQSAGNKILSPTGRDYVLMPASSVWVYKDTTSACWRIATDRNAATELPQDSTATIGFLRQAFTWLGEHIFAPTTPGVYGLVATGTTSTAGVRGVGGSNAAGGEFAGTGSGPGIESTATGTGDGAICTGGGAGAGATCQGGASGNGARCVGGATDGCGVLGLGDGASVLATGKAGGVFRGAAGYSGAVAYGPASGAAQAAMVANGLAGNNRGIEGYGSGSGNGAEFTGGSSGNAILAKTGGLYGLFIEAQTNRAAIHMDGIAGDPPGVTDGDIWYDSTSGKFRCREGGVSKNMI